MISFLIALLGITLFTTLLISKQFGPGYYCFLIALVILISLVIHGFDRLKELDLKNLRMTLSEIKATKEDIFAKQKDLEKTAILMSQVLSFSSSAQGRLGSKEGFKIRRLWYEKKLNKIINNFNFRDDEIKEIKKYAEEYKKLDNLFLERDKYKQETPEYKVIKEKIDKIINGMDEMLKKDIKNNS